MHIDDKHLWERCILKFCSYLNVFFHLSSGYIFSEANMVLSLYQISDIDKYLLSSNNKIKVLVVIQFYQWRKTTAIKTGRSLVSDRGNNKSAQEEKDGLSIEILIFHNRQPKLDLHLRMHSVSIITQIWEFDTHPWGDILDTALYDSLSIIYRMAVVYHWQDFYQS
jgi:hypothetical protein